jgi:hypothetical protein
MARAHVDPLRFIDRERCDTLEAPRETFTIAGTSFMNCISHPLLPILFHALRLIETLDIVQVRHIPNCSCSDFTFRRTPCKHLIYTMIKVLKVSPSSPLLHQYALTSTELRSIFDSAPKARHLHKPFSSVHEKEEDPGRKPVDGDCPICFMDFADSEQDVTWCRKFCGNNVHEGCMRTWLGAQKRQYGHGTCPYCRGEWAEV